MLRKIIIKYKLKKIDELKESLIYMYGYGEMDKISKEIELLKTTQNKLIDELNNIKTKKIKRKINRVLIGENNG